MKILLVEDDRRLGSLIRHMLEREKIAVEWLQRGDLAQEYAERCVYDLVILDWMLPGRSGLEVCANLRQNGYQGGIIMLTAKDSVQDRVRGLDSGADDYVVKPFEFAELLARIRALQRRSDSQRPESTLLVGNLELDPSTRTVKKGNQTVHLTGKEFELLELLAKNRSQVLSRDMIINRIWGVGSDITSNNLDAHIRLLRKKLDVPGEEPVIQNVRGVGYRLYAPDVRANS